MTFNKNAWTSITSFIGNAVFIVIEHIERVAGTFQECEADIAQRIGSATGTDAYSGAIPSEGHIQLGVVLGLAIALILTQTEVDDVREIQFIVSILTHVCHTIEQEHDVFGEDIRPLQMTNLNLQAQTTQRGVGWIRVKNTGSAIRKSGFGVDTILIVAPVIDHIIGFLIGVEDPLAEQSVPFACPTWIVGIVEAIGPECGPRCVVCAFRRNRAQGASHTVDP